MVRKLIRAVATSCLVVTVVCACTVSERTAEEERRKSDRSGVFADHDGVLPPAEQYSGPFFELSQDYPSLPPEPDEQPWLHVEDPRSNHDAYLLAVRDYFYEGMLECDFRCQRNPVRKWYQMPWMHVGRNPREAIRGLTNERASRPGDLGPAQTEYQQNWGTGFFNPQGGYTVGQVWKDCDAPDPRKARFLEGTVVVKILFSAAPRNQVPDLAGSPEWTAYINEDGRPPQPRELRTVRLLQMDIAVKDARAGTSGWFFGSLVYDKDYSGRTPWQRLAPGGLQWGNDPGYGPDEQEAGKALAETAMSVPVPTLATYKRELGWLGRLNGPVDNPVSSCMSCHSTAQWKNVATMVPARGATSEQRQHWFRTLPGSTAFSEGQIPLDYSLQMQLALQNFHDPDLNPEFGSAEAIAGCQRVGR